MLDREFPVAAAVVVEHKGRTNTVPCTCHSKVDFHGGNFASPWSLTRAACPKCRRYFIGRPCEHVDPRDRSRSSFRLADPSCPLLRTGRPRPPFPSLKSLDGIRANSAVRLEYSCHFISSPLVSSKRTSRYRINL